MDRARHLARDRWYPDRDAAVNYRNTRVVQSIHASALIPIADLFVSAAGYNSFHEALYAQTPTIFIPQMASYMDDQRARAQAAAERDVAILIEPWELLKLTQAIDDCIDWRGAALKESLRALELPEPGMHAAAKHIQEVMR
ncbi:glycosyltransferase [Pseudorhodobacter sp. W20_MBD10_FR17]|uniref:glycosyltransferase n=1 Tax=Pseudorhodobacter sp. W20_MBD10_FR17 TaxID=3240266 RepID=UPI003F9B89CA